MFKFATAGTPELWARHSLLLRLIRLSVIHTSYFKLPVLLIDNAYPYMLMFKTLYYLYSPIIDTIIYTFISPIIFIALCHWIWWSFCASL